jgi:heparan-alpha-glucosaminide N-acetyltransferase
MSGMATEISSPTSDAAPTAGLPHVSSPKPLSNRVGSIDAYRGLVMLLMMAEVLELRKVANAVPDSSLWQTLAFHQTHAEWLGCSLHDLIQPSFSFLVGVALPFSLLRRASEGQSAWWRTLHAFWRALVLVLLGVFLRSIGKGQTYWTFEDTLTQIGLGYGFLYVLANRSTLVQWSALVVLLVGYWALFAWYPLPDSDFKLAAVGNPAAVTQFDGFAGHWSKNTNAAWAFDTWFLNLFPRENPFKFNEGGYCTLSFIPTLATMILGLLAGGVLARRSTSFQGSALERTAGEAPPRDPVGKTLPIAVGRTAEPCEQRIPRQSLGTSGAVVWLAAAGVLSLAAGWLLGALGICPVVKRIWTPSWVLFSGGWCFLFLAAFYLVMDVWGFRKWAFVLVVVGMNSIAAYLIAHLFVGFINKALPRHLGASVFQAAGPAYEPFLLGLGVLIVEWLILYWMYRRKIFLRI